MPVAPADLAPNAFPSLPAGNQPIGQMRGEGKPMHEESAAVASLRPANTSRQALVQRQDAESWLGWAGHHAGVLLLGALALSVLALPHRRSVRDVEHDITGEEVPLFI